MRNPFNFESEPFELYSEFDEELEGFDTEMADLEWEEEFRRGAGIPFRPRAPRFRTVHRRRLPKPPRRLPRRPPGLIIRPRPRPRVVFSEPPTVEPGPQGREYVRWVQSSLNRIMGLRLPVNGVMGPETRSAIRSFQERQRLPADGIVGPDTERAIIAARGDQQPTEPTDSQPPGPGDSQPSEPGEFEAFDTDSEFDEEMEMLDEYEGEADTYSELDEEYESDFEAEPFEIYHEYDEAYEMETDPPPVDIGAGRVICGVVYRDFKAWYDSLSDLWQELRNKGSRDKIKEARLAYFAAVNKIVTRLDKGWYASKGCKEVDFNFIITKAIMTDKELKEDEKVQKISKWVSNHAREALKKAQKASQRSRPVRGRK